MYQLTTAGYTIEKSRFIPIYFNRKPYYKKGYCMTRFGYTLRQLKRHRTAINAFKSSPQLQAQSITDIDPKALTKNNIKALALDFDGVLANHGDKKPLPDVEKWLNTATTLFQTRLFILSNKPDEIRRQYFRQQYPNIQFMSGVRKKPYPDGLNEIIRLANITPQQLMLIDDRLWTGILASIIAGNKAIWITKAYCNFSRRPISESFFALLRTIEKLIKMPA